MFPLIPLILLSFLSPLSAFQLYHRVLHPDIPDHSLVHRGTIQEHDGNARIDAVPSLQSDLLAFAETSAHVTDALYQLALDPGQSDSLWLFSSVKAVTIFLPLPGPSFSFPPPFLQCHLISPANEHIVIHIPSSGGPPFALDYFLDSVPPDGSCPPVSSPTLASPRNATITFSVPARPPLFVAMLSHLTVPLIIFLVSRPELRAPPPLTATGDPVVQVPEKTFLQKYWIYLVIALGAVRTCASYFRWTPFSYCVSYYS